MNELLWTAQARERLLPRGGWSSRKRRGLYLFHGAAFRSSGRCRDCRKYGMFQRRMISFIVEGYPFGPFRSHAQLHRTRNHYRKIHSRYDDKQYDAGFIRLTATGRARTARRHATARGRRARQFWERGDGGRTSTIDRTLYRLSSAVHHQEEILWCSSRSQWLVSDSWTIWM